MNHQRHERGSILVITALLITALLGFGALAVDGVYLMEVRAELQNTADATALASTSGLTVDQKEAGQRAASYAALNPVIGASVDLAKQEVTNGQWNGQTNTFVPAVKSANSSRVILRLTSTSTPTAPALFFGPVLGQQRGSVTATSTAALSNRNIMITLDRSGSMDDDTKQGGPPQPITDTKSAAKGFVNLIKNYAILGERIGLVWFSSDATLNNQLTDQLDVVKTAIGVPNASGWTNIAAALCMARKEILSARADPDGLKVIVLLSDGKTNTRTNPATCAATGQLGIDDGKPAGNTSELQALAQANLIAGDHTILYTISLGNDTNLALMRQMAQVTGGEDYFAPTAADLLTIFQKIASKIPMRLVQ